MLASSLTFILLACSEGQRTDSRAVDSLANPTGAAPNSAQTGDPRRLTGNRVAGILFDPVAVRVGDRIGAMSLDSIDVRTAYDSTRVGTARFSGVVELSGAKMRHFDSDSDALCFEADSSSAARLPRWAGDERRSWFCFTNRAAAQTALGPPADSTPATVVIDRLTIHRGLSDEVNSARFVRAVAR